MTDTTGFDVVFLDSGRTSECKSDPKFPEGQPINLAPNAIVKTCSRNLPYPAPRCGVYQIRCLKCGYTAAVTVAGRADDPRMVTMPCYGNLL